MYNEFLWFLMLFSIYSILIFIYKFFKKSGMFIWICISIIISNIQVLKQISIFGFNATLGNIIYASSYLATDILTEIYGKKISQKAVYIGFLTFIFFISITNIQLCFTNKNLNINESLTAIFTSIPILFIASMISYLISQLNDVSLYQLIRKKFPRFLFIRSNGSTLISEFIDTLIFVSIATYFDIFAKETYASIIISTYLIKGLAGILGTPFLYIAKYIFTNKSK